MNFSLINSSVRFIRSTKHENCGWVVKMPFTTNSMSIRYCKDLDAIMSAIDGFATEFEGRNHYTMLQPCLANKREYKVVCHNKVPIYIGNIGTAKGKSFAHYQDVMQFAKTAINELLFHCPSVLIDGLFRVDIMSTVTGRFVVNEFESIEANSSSKNFYSQIQTSTFLQQYWIRQLDRAFKQL